MGIENFGDGRTPEQVDKFGTKLLSKYGPVACEAAALLDESNMNSGSARTYKPQVRQVVSATDDKIPSPRDTIDVIDNADKQGSTKNVMVVAMKKYYELVDEYEMADEVDKLAKEEQIAEIDFNRDMQVDEWITKDEVVRIENHILPPNGSRFHELSGAGQSYIITLEHKALVMALFYTGCRVGEVCEVQTGDETLTLGDLHPETDRIELYRLKKKGNGYKRDMKVVPDRLWDVLEEYTEEYGIGDIHEDNDSRLFPFVKRTAQNRITEVHNAYEFTFGGFEHMEKLTPHKFRHGRITDLANHAGLEEAGQYVEHSSPEVTDAYRHLAAEQQREILPEESESDEPDSMSEVMEALDVEDADEAIEVIENIKGDSTADD